MECECGSKENQEATVVQQVAVVAWITVSVVEVKVIGESPDELG